MDKQSMIATFITLLSIVVIAIIQYRLGFENGYKQGEIVAKKHIKQELDKVLDKYNEECTISTED